MNCLLVIAHPQKDSLCGYLARKVQEQIEAKGHQVTVKNLYEDAFNPVLRREERDSYYQAAFDQQWVAEEIAQLKQAEMLVLVFPTWWFSFPAILKGWFDRVWAPGHAYDHASDFGPITAKLTKLKQVRVITTLGSPWWVDRLIMWRPVRRVLKTAILGTCSKQHDFRMLSFYNSETASSERVDRFVNKIKGWF